jgi:hypothetical protein
VYVGKPLHPKEYTSVQDFYDAFYQELETLQKNVKQ